MEAVFIQRGNGAVDRWDVGRVLRPDGPVRRTRLEAGLIECDHEEVMAFSALMLAFAMLER